MKRIFLFVLLLCLAQAQTQTPGAVSLDREPDHHLFLENEYVRVFKVEVPPHASTLMHQHDRDYVFVTLGDSEVENDVAGKPPVKLKLKDGEARFTKGGFAHVAKNRSGKPFRNITIELKQSQTPQGNSKGVTRCNALNERECYSTTAWLESASVWGRSHTLTPGASTGQHRHDAPHLAIAVSDLDFRDERPGQPPRELHRKAGEVTWVPGGYSHSLTNIGKAPARFVTLEFREAAPEKKP